MPVSSDRFRRIFLLAMPIIGGMISQNVLNLVDTAMVGYLGDAALAAVGVGGFASFMLQAMVLGLSPAVQAMAARRIGEGYPAAAGGPLNAALMIALVFSLPWSILLYFLVPVIFPVLNSDPNVIAAGTPYLQLRILGIVFVGMNFSFRGFWNAIDRPGMYLRTLLVMHSINIVLNYTLIFGKFGFPEMGVTGAAIGTFIATGIGTLYYFYLGLRHARPFGFLTKRPRRDVYSPLVRLAVPSGIQQFFFATGFTLTYWIIGQVGTAELAAANVLINIMLICILPGIALGIAAATLVGQALGAAKPDDATRWGWEVVITGVLLLTLLGLPIALFSEQVLTLFIHDPDTRSIANIPLKIVGFTIWFEAVGLVLMNALLGAGDNKRVSIVSIAMQYLLFLPAAYLIGPVLGYGLLEIWLAMFAQRALQSLIFAGIWKRGDWQQIKV